MSPTPARSNFRSSALIVILTCTLLSVGIRVADSATAPPAPPSALAPVPVRMSLGSDIRSYMRLPGDRVVEVPDGTYSGGNVTAPHPETAGPLKGWLVLVAESPHGVVVDLSSGMLNLYSATSRIMFVGFRFINGTVKVTGADDIKFWYTEHTFPATEWYRQWVAAGGGTDVSQTRGLAALKAMANPQPDALVVANYLADTANSIQLYGVDVHDVGELGVRLAGNDHRIVGTRIWNINEGSYDPGYGVPGGDGTQGNTVQTEGGLYRAVLQDSYLNGKIQWGGRTGNVSDSQFDDLWMAGSENAGILVDGSSGRAVTGHLNTIRAFANRYPFRVDVDNGVPNRLWPRVHYSGLTTSGIDTSAPSGTVGGNGRLIQSVALANPDNPANRWRATNPYDMWRQLLSMRVASTTEVPVAATTLVPVTTTTSTPITTTTSTPVTTTTSVPPQPAGPVPVRVSLGSDIRSYMRLAGDRVVEVPDGTYSGGNVTAPHPETAGPLKGWLVLVAESPHGVVVDLSSGMLNLYPTTSRIMFVGFKFVNGTVRVTGADNIRFWYTEHTFPAAEWYRQWVAAGGGHDVSQAQGIAAMNAMANPRPKALVVANYQADTANSIQLYGVDIHDVGDDGIDVQGSGIRVEGARIWNIDEQNADPGYGGAGGATDAFHNDSIQTGGGAYQVAVQHSYVNGKVQWGAQTGNIRDAQFDDLWMAGSPNAGILVDVWSGYSVAGEMSGIRSFANTYGFRMDVSGKTIVRWPMTLYPSFTTSGIDTTAPVGTVDGSGRLVQSAALAHPDNPANRWRATSPYDLWSTLFS